MYNSLPIFLNLVIWSGSFLIALTPVLVFQPNSLLQSYFYFAVVPVLFILSFIGLAGGLSRLGRRGIIRGTFPRQPFHPIYLLRRIYGVCWTQVYYFKPLYSVALSIPLLKKLLFRVFGYKYSTNFVVYPDTWIRDLPVLKIGEGAYLSNRATIGTNICLSDGNILVDSVEVEEKGLIGHLAVLAPGAKIGKKAEVGVSATIAIRTTLKENSKIHPCCMINHGAVVGEGTKIGTMSYVGVKTILGPHLNIPAGANIPAGMVLMKQEEVNQYYSSETQSIKEHIAAISEKFRGVADYEFKA